MAAQTPTPALYLQIEGPTGVMEAILGFVSHNGMQRIVPIGVRNLSGESQPVNAEMIREALELDQWSILHADVFHEGRVVTDPPVMVDEPDD